MPDHSYLSAACQHPDKHDCCDIECEFCAALCRCSCHNSDERFQRYRQAKEMQEQDKEMVEI